MNRLCGNCGSRELEGLFVAQAFDTLAPPQASSFEIARCQQCGLTATLGVDEAILDQAYHSDYYGSGQQKFHALAEALVRRLARARAGQLTALWQSAGETDDLPSVLDIGCGRGVLLRAFLEQGSGVRGLERAQFPADDDMAGHVTVGSLEDLGESRFDIVVLWHVLEHLAGPEQLLRQVAIRLNGGGCLALAVPNFASFQSRLFGRHWFHLDLPRHLVHLEAGWLRQQLQRAGFIVERESYFEPVQSLFGFIQSAMNALLPRRRNRLYELLKFRGSRDVGDLVELGLWSVLGALLMPLALLETAAGLVFNRGATVQFVARWQGAGDDQ